MKKLVNWVECGYNPFTESCVSAVLILFVLLLLSEMCIWASLDIVHHGFFYRIQRTLQTWRLSFEDARSYLESLRPFYRRQENLCCSMLKTAPR